MPWNTGSAPDLRHEARAATRPSAAGWLLLLVTLAPPRAAADAGRTARDAQGEVQVADATGAPPTSTEADPKAEAEAEPEKTAPASEATRTGLTAFPVVAFLPEAGFVLGGYAVRTQRMPNQSMAVPASALPVLLAVTTRGELGFEFTPSIYLGAQGQWWVTADLTGRIRNSARYFGLGNSTRLERVEEMRQRQLGLNARVLHRVVKQLFVGGASRVEWQVIDDLAPDGQLTRQALPGLGGNLLVALGPSIVYDTRDMVRGPLTGFLLELSAPIHTPLLGSDHDFTQIRLDLRRYFQLHGEHVLATRILSDATLGTPPLTELPGVAGSNSMRGFIRGRFRERQMLSVELEYRFPIYGRLRGAAFVGAGQVARRHVDFRLHRFHVAGGLGLRFTLDREERVRVRLDAAATEEGSVRPYFAPLEAF